MGHSVCLMMKSSYNSNKKIMGCTALPQIHPVETKISQLNHRPSSYWLKIEHDSSWHHTIIHFL